MNNTLENRERIMKANIYSGLIMFFLLVPVLALGLGANNSVAIEKTNSDEQKKSGGQGLALSDMHVKITSQGYMATFQLYNTDAARQLYDQLPLKLGLTNFRDAQWMFYPPKKLSVTAGEAYHDGKKGELSYYAPWGDVFMLYKDFDSGDQMHRLGIGLTGIDKIAAMSGSALIEKNEPSPLKTQVAMKVNVKAKGDSTLFELNNSPTAREFYAQLPLSIKVENYSSNEKIFYLPKKLNTADAPRANAETGTLAYYAPWGNVVMFYGRFGSAAGLYELGHAVSGSEHIREMSDIIELEKSK